MVFRRLRRNQETNPSQTTAGQFDSGDSSANADLSPRERAKIAREQRARFGQAAIRAARQDREKLYGTGETSRANQPNQGSGESRTNAEQIRKAAEEAQRIRDAEDQRLKDAQEAQRQQNEARRQQQDEARRQQKEQARQQRATSTLSKAEAHALAMQKKDRIRQADAERRRLVAERGTPMSDQVDTVMDGLGAYILPEDQTSLATFDERIVRHVIATILTQRDGGSSDYKIWLGFMEDANNKKDDRRAVMLSQASGALTLKYKYLDDSDDSDVRDRLIDTTKDRELMSYIF